MAKGPVFHQVEDVVESQTIYRDQGNITEEGFEELKSPEEFFDVEECLSPSIND